MATFKELNLKLTSLQQEVEALRAQAEAHTSVTARAERAEAALRIQTRGYTEATKRAERAEAALAAQQAGLSKLSASLGPLPDLAASCQQALEALESALSEGQLLRARKALQRLKPNWTALHGRLVNPMPAPVRPLRRSVLTFALVFAEAMEEKLRANDHKGGWQDADPEELLGGLMGELGELAELLDIPEKERAADWVWQVRAEAADVANCTLMIADHCGALCPDGQHAILAEATRESA